MLFAIEVPPFDQSILDFVPTCCALQQEIHCFTDGACFQPDSRESRFAAFDIAVDLCYNDATPGEQDVLRSEMFAAATVMLGIGEGVIHIGKPSGTAFLDLAVTCTDPAVLYRKDNFGILLSASPFDAVWPSKYFRPLGTNLLTTLQSMPEITPSLTWLLL